MERGRCPDVIATLDVHRVCIDGIEDDELLCKPRLWSHGAKWRDIADIVDAHRQIDIHCLLATWRRDPKNALPGLVHALIIWIQVCHRGTLDAHRGTRHAHCGTMLLDFSSGHDLIGHPPTLETTGSLCYPPGSTCDNEGLSPPIIEYSHTALNGCSITGGYVYRGNAIPSLEGNYVFADYCSGRVWIASPQSTQTLWPLTPVLDSGMQVSSFGEDAQGELYITDLRGGTGVQDRPRHRFMMGY